MLPKLISLTDNKDNVEEYKNKEMYTLHKNFNMKKYLNFFIIFFMCKFVSIFYIYTQYLNKKFKEFKKKFNILISF